MWTSNVCTIGLQTVDESATADEDYVPKNNLNVTIDGYQQEEVIINILEDGQVEGNECFSVEITGADVGEGITNVDITIADNDRKNTCLFLLLLISECGRSILFRF